MSDGAPLTSNEKALAISLLVVGGLAALFTLFTIASSAYVLATGHVMGSEVSQAFAQGLQKNDEMKELMQRQQAAQVEVQTRWAPIQLASEGLYFAAVAGAMLFAIFALRSGGNRARIGQLALLASAVRAGVGVVTFLFTSELMRSTSGAMMAAISGGQRGMSAEKADDLKRITAGAMTGLSAATAGCTTLVMCVYFAVVAYVFLVAKKPPSTPTAP